MPEIVDITEESKKYDDEWLLFEVTQVTEQDLPVKGRLLCHSKSRDEVQEVAMRHRGKDLKITFVGERVPAGGYAVL